MTVDEAAEAIGRMTATMQGAIDALTNVAGIGTLAVELLNEIGSPDGVAVAVAFKIALQRAKAQVDACVEASRGLDAVLKANLGEG